MKKLINRLSLSLLIAVSALPGLALADINTFYDLKLKYEQTKESITHFKDAIFNSPVYGMIAYAGVAILLFVIAVLMIFFLFSLLRR